MASLIPGFEYDIFISYRQKDNKGEKWVSDFVEALKTELESTFKEEVTVYFDINPHDGLLETHDVDASLKDKLRCIVFIPIISRTYCDPKSFAWEHEFKAFVEQASHDQFGIKVKLPNGNVASRVLPVRIHDLDTDDINLCESILGGALRGIEFIYKEPGINKPLSSGDDEKINLNKTKYRNQINKTANAIHEIIHSLKKINQKGGNNSQEDVKQESSQRIRKRISIILITIPLLLLFGYIFHENIFSLFNTKTRNLRDESVINVEVVNNTVNSAKMIDPELIVYLIKFNLSNKCNITLLDEIQFNKIHPYNRGTINLPSRNIDIKVVIGESLHQDEIDLKITDNQDNSVTQNKIKISNIDDFLNFTGNLEKIASYFDAVNVRKNLLTTDWNSFKNFYQGEKEWSIRDKVDAMQYYQTSKERDPSFILPYLRLANIYHHAQDDETSREYIDFVIKSIDKLSIPDSLRARALWHSLNLETPEAIKNYRQLIEFLPAQKESYFDLAEAYFRICDIENARENYTKALRIDPDFTLAHNHLAYCFCALGEHDSAVFHVRRYLDLDSSANAWDSYGDILFARGELENASMAKKRGLELDKRLDYLYESLAYINVQQGLIKEALNNIDKYIALQKEPNIISRGLTDKAFIYFVKKEFKRSLNTCLEAKQIFDSKDLLTRNHILHWILSKLYIELNDTVSLDRELKEMNEIINKNKIDGFKNYNMIFKFYNDIKIHQLFRQNRVDEARILIDLFDKDIYEKVKDWNYPFDIAFFNSEFGKLYLEKGMLEPAKERFDKALEYNPKYIFAHMGLTVYYEKMKNLTERDLHYNQFYEVMIKSDPEIQFQFMREFDRFRIN